MIYEVKTVKDIEDIELAKRVSVSNYRWTEAPGPDTMASMVYVKDIGFAAQLLCAQKDPVAEISEPDGKVSQEGALEFFVNFDPEHSDKYINLEANALGTLHCKIGPGRKDRKPLRELGIPMPELKLQRDEDGWSIRYFVPLSCIEKLYGKSRFKEGDSFKGNFYTCREGVEPNYFGMWSEVISEKPDFHRPEFFGDFIIV